MDLRSTWRRRPDSFSFTSKPTVPCFNCSSDLWRTSLLARLLSCCRRCLLVCLGRCLDCPLLSDLHLLHPYPDLPRLLYPVLPLSPLQPEPKPPDVLYCWSFEQSCVPLVLPSCPPVPSGLLPFDPSRLLVALGPYTTVPVQCKEVWFRGAGSFADKTLRSLIFVRNGTSCWRKVHYLRRS